MPSGSDLLKQYRHVSPGTVPRTCELQAGHASNTTGLDRLRLQTTARHNRSKLCCQSTPSLHITGRRTLLRGALYKGQVVQQARHASGDTPCPERGKPPQSDLQTSATGLQQVLFSPPCARFKGSCCHGIHGMQTCIAWVLLCNHKLDRNASGVERANDPQMTASRGFVLKRRTA